jgi:hypothetical protein
MAEQSHLDVHDNDETLENNLGPHPDVSNDNLNQSIFHSTSFFGGSINQSKVGMLQHDQ